MRVQVLEQLKKMFNPAPTPVLGRWNSVIHDKYSHIYSTWATGDHSRASKNKKRKKERLNVKYFYKIIFLLTPVKARPIRPWMV